MPQHAQLKQQLHDALIANGYAVVTLDVCICAQAAQCVGVVEVVDDGLQRVASTHANHCVQS